MKTGRVATLVSKEEEKETKEERWQRVVTPRIERALKYIGLIGNCSSRSSYSYSPAQIDEMCSRLGQEVTKLRTVYSHAAKEEQPRFHFTMK
jgi:hypothetical protein